VIGDFTTGTKNNPSTEAEKTNGLCTKLSLARSHLQSVLTVELGRRQVNIYFSSVQSGQQNASGTLVTPLTSQMCSRTSSSPPPCRHWPGWPDGLVMTTTKEKILGTSYENS